MATGHTHMEQMTKCKKCRNQNFLIDFVTTEKHLVCWATPFRLSRTKCHFLSLTSTLLLQGLHISSQVLSSCWADGHACRHESVSQRRNYLFVTLILGSFISLHEFGHIVVVVDVGTTHLYRSWLLLLPNGTWECPIHMMVAFGSDGVRFVIWLFVANIFHTSFVRSTTNHHVWVCAMSRLLLLLVEQIASFP